MRWWHRSSGFRLLLWTVLRTGLHPRTSTRARNHGATLTPGSRRRGPVSPPAVNSDPSNGVCWAGKQLRHRFATRQRDGTAERRAVGRSGLTAGPAGGPGRPCTSSPGAAPAPPRPPGALCFPLDLELGSRLPMCRQPWGRASGSVRLAGRGHVSGDATLFLRLTPGSRPTLHAASREGERAGVPRVPLLTHAAGGALHTCSPAHALPAPDVWGSLLLDGSPAGAVWLCLGPSPGGRRGGCCLRTTPRAGCVCVTRVRAACVCHTRRGASSAQFPGVEPPLRAQRTSLCSVWPNPIPGVAPVS